MGGKARAVRELAVMHPDVLTLPIRIIYRDDHLVAVDKPAGMLVHRASHARDPRVVMTFVRDELGVHAWPLHRLDRYTSGIVLVAVTLEAARRMYALFEAGGIDKTYLAVVRGEAPARGRIDEPLDGKASVTEYERVAAAGGHSLLRVHPRNGRRHQIRRHLHGVGLPIVGDPNYGEAGPDERLGLHAVRLVFAHPFSGEVVVVEAAPPGDFVALFEGDVRPALEFPSPP